MPLIAAGIRVRQRRRGNDPKCPECGADAFKVTGPRKVCGFVFYWCKCGTCRASFKRQSYLESTFQNPPCVVSISG